MAYHLACNKLDVDLSVMTLWRALRVFIYLLRTRQHETIYN